MNTTPKLNEAAEGGSSPVPCSPSSDLGYDAELTTAQLHAQWVAKYEQVQELWNIDNCQKNDRIEELERGDKQWRYEWDQLREDFKSMMATRNSDPSYSLDEALDHFYDLHPTFDPENDPAMARRDETPPA